LLSSSFSRLQDYCPEPAFPNRSRSVEEEALDILLKLDEEDAVQPDLGPGAWPNIRAENARSQLGPVRKQKAEKSVPKIVPTNRPSEVARLLLKQAALLKRRS